MTRAEFALPRKDTWQTNGKPMSVATTSDAEPSAAVAVMRTRCDKFKDAGNASLKTGDAAAAVKNYTKALALAQSLGEPAPTEKMQTCRVATLHANRCQAHLNLGDERSALADAQAAAKTAPDWPKAHFRLGTVHMRRKAFTQALAAFKRGWHIDPSNVELTKACQQAHQAMTGLDTINAAAGSSAVVPAGAADAKASNKPMTAEDLHRLRETAARQAQQERDERRRAQAPQIAAHPDAPVADPAYRTEALARTARMAQGGKAEEGAAPAPPAPAAAEAEAAAAPDVSDADGAAAAPPSAGAATAAEEDDVDDDDDDDDEEEPAAEPALEFVLAKRPGAYADGRDLLTVTVYVPSCAAMSELDLAISAREMRVTAPQAPPLEVDFKAFVDDGAAKAKWDKKGRVLTVRAPIGAAPPPKSEEDEGEVV